MSISNSFNVIPIEYSLQTYHRSNQDTTLLHRPVVKEGDWVQAGDLISDSGASIGGEFSIGQNLLIAYLPWEGYNYEDAILISERLVYDDLYTSIHIERYDISTEKTPYGNEIITKDILLLKDTNELEHLDENGVAQLGSWLKEGDILVGKITPTEPKKEVARYIQLYNDILGKKIDYSFRDTSLRVPRGLEAKVIRVQLFPEKKTRLTKLGLVKKKPSVKLPKVKGYKKKIEPIYLRTHYQGLQIKEKFFVLNSRFFLAKKGLFLWEKFEATLSLRTSSLKKKPKADGSVKLRLTEIAKKGEAPKALRPFPIKKRTFPIKKNRKKGQSWEGLFQEDFVQRTKSSKQSPSFQRQKKRIKANSTSFLLGKSRDYVPTFLHSLFFLYSRKKQSERKKEQNKCKKPIFSWSINNKKSPKKSKTISPLINSVHVYLAEKRKVQVGDKMAGRHGNKGIISQILPRQDMPYLPDGSPIDLALNPLGVPSRMNVGQIYECLLGLAGKNLGEQYRIKPFDESFGSEASRSFVFSKLYEARLKTRQSWLFQPINPGKLKLFDGRTGNRYDQAITAGYSYMIKLVHLVDEKIHSRSSGPYSLITQQPLKGRSKHGGQRLGEMEVWAIEAYGAAFILLELLTIKSDDVTGRLTIWDYILYKKPLYIGTPASFKVLICELQALCLDIGIYKADPSNALKQIHVSSMG